jgi:hypothetical protein
VWDEHWFGSTTTLDMDVSALRRKLGESDGAPGRIMTLRGVAYSLRHHIETPHHRYRLVARRPPPRLGTDASRRGCATPDSGLQPSEDLERWRADLDALANRTTAFGPRNSLGGRVDVVDVVVLDLDVVPRQLREAVERASVSW